ncbi:MAG: MOSC domain-containing protein [Thermomicrobiales bacterium]
MSPFDAGRIAGIWRYPLKSAPGEALAETAMGRAGIPGDRAWALIDGGTGHIASAKLPRAWGGLLRFSARFAKEPAAGGFIPPLVVTLPDGRIVSSDEPEVDIMISEAIGRPARLTSVVPELRIVEREWADIDGLPTRAAETTGEIGRRAPGAFFDHAPVHVLTTAALAALKAADPTGDADPRRFRPTLLIDSPGDNAGFVENDWTGRAAEIGDLVLRFVEPSPRCIVVTLPHGELPHDLGVLRTLVGANRIPYEPDSPLMPCLGAYAVVEHPGKVRIGDSVIIR